MSADTDEENKNPAQQEVTQQKRRSAAATTDTAQATGDEKPELVEAIRLVPRRKKNGQLVGTVPGLEGGMRTYEPHELRAVFRSQERIDYLLRSGVFSAETVQVQKKLAGPKVYSTEAEADKHTTPPTEEAAPSTGSAA